LAFGGIEVLKEYRGSEDILVGKVNEADQLCVIKKLILFSELFNSLVIYPPKLTFSFVSHYGNSFLPVA